MSTQAHLRQQLLALDRQNYGAYKSLRGSYQFPGFMLVIDRVQGDPFAAPSQCRILRPQVVAGFPPELYANRSREIALRDYLNRQFDQGARHFSQARGSGKSGLIAINSPGQAILERSAVWIDDRQLEVRFVVGLPAFGRRIAGQAAVELLCDGLPRLVEQTLTFKCLDTQAVQTHVEVAEDADALRDQLADRGLVAFVANGAVLPRRSGVDDRPLEQDAIRFQSPPSLQVTLTTPNQGPITGMGIPQGVTLIVGGGYHGKSTLLKAIAQGVYNHIPNDGRERVVTAAHAVTIRAEDGRSITQVDLSPFITHLPQGRSTTDFSTPNASGSTSQAANILEALEAGARTLLIDEDTSATNFMIRDRRMQALIAKDREPITPFLDKVRQLYQEYGVSSILVMGGSGDYFEVADTVIAMTDFQPQDVTAQAQAIAQQYPTDRHPEGGPQFGTLPIRQVIPSSFVTVDSARPPQWKTRDTDRLRLNHEELDLSAVSQLLETGQLRAIAATLVYAQSHLGSQAYPLPDLVIRLMATIAQTDFAALGAVPSGEFVGFRPYELAAAINRLRSLQVQIPKPAHISPNLHKKTDRKGDSRKNF